MRMINRGLNIPPLILDAVMNGIGNAPDEQIHLQPGSWKNCEDWTVPTAHVMWLMAELQEGKRQ
jgi:hypothetical protein